MRVDFHLQSEGTAVVKRKTNVMYPKQTDFLVLVTCAIIYGSVAFIFLILCCRILLKCKSEKRSEKEESEIQSHITSFSEVSPSVRIDEERKAPKINEAYFVQSSAEDNVDGAKTYSDVDKNVEGQVWQQLTFRNTEDERREGSHVAA